MTDPITPADERVAFWVSVTRYALISGIVLIGCLILLPVTPKGPATVAVLTIGILAGLWLVKVAWMAASFVIDDQRERE